MFLLLMKKIVIDFKILDKYLHLVLSLKYYLEFVYDWSITFEYDNN